MAPEFAPTMVATLSPFLRSTIVGIAETAYSAARPCSQWRFLYPRQVILLDKHFISSPSAQVCVHRDAYRVANKGTIEVNNEI